MYSTNVKATFAFRNILYIVLASITEFHIQAHSECCINSKLQ